MSAIIQTKNNVSKEFFYKTKERAFKKYDVEVNNSHWSKVLVRKAGTADFRVVCWDWYIN